MTIDLKIKFQQKLSLILIILITSAISNALSASINIDNENYVDLKNVVSYIENSNIDDDYSFFADPNVIFNSSAIDQQQNHIYYNYQQNFSFFDQIEQNNADMVNTENVTDTRSLLMFSPSITVLLAVLSGLMSLITILGNILVITAFIIDKNLRSYSNYFILNLSIADLLIGLLIPPYAPFLLANRRWVLGRAACTIWLVLDYVVGSASVLCIVVISLDRYLLVSRGLNYVAKQKVSKAICIMVTVWVIAFLNYAPAIVFWELISGKSTVPEGDCQVEFHNNLAYLTATACVEFFVPLISICTLNIAVYLNIRKRSKGLIRSKNPQFCIVNDDNQKGSLNNNKTDANNSSNKANNGSVKVSPIKTHKKETNGKITKAIISMSPSTSSASSEISPICQYKVVDIKSQQSTVNNNNDKHYKNTSCPQFNNPPQITATTTSTIGGNTTVTTSITNKSINDSEIESKKTLNKKNLKLKISNSESTNLSKVSSKVKRTSLSSKTPSSSNSLSKDKKAARSLFILVFVFVCCWVSLKISKNPLIFPLYYSFSLSRHPIHPQHL